MKQNKCYVCGRTGSNFCLLETNPDVPEIKKGTYVCSQRCYNSLIGTIKRSRKVSSKNKKRKELEESEKVPTDDDFFDIFVTLNSKEKMILCAVAMGVIFAESHTIKDFFKLLKTKVEHEK